MDRRLNQLNSCSLSRMLHGVYVCVCLALDYLMNCVKDSRPMCQTPSERTNGLPVQVEFNTMQSN